MHLAATLNKHSPELITRGQFKLVMTDIFKVRDPKLLENVFMLADLEGEGALDVRELCAIMLIHMRGELEFKLALFFEIMKCRTVAELFDGGFILK